MFKKLMCAFFAVLTILATVTTASAAKSPISQSYIAEESASSPRAEQFEWVYRIVDGKTQKRIWSITRGCWVTDWIDC